MRASYPTDYLPLGRNASQLLLRGKGVPMMSLVKRHPIITFFVLTYAIAWGLIPFWTFQAGAPFIAALIVIPLTQGLSGLKELGLRMIRWRVRWYWYVVAIALPLAVLGLTVGLNVALGASVPSLAGVGSVTTVLITLISHAAQGTIQIGALWSVGADFAQANLLFGIVSSAVAIGLVVFDWKAWRAPAPAPATTTPPVMPPREAAPVAPA